jgi:hypothetical protein
VFAHDDCARRFELPYDLCVFRGNPIRKEGAGRRGSHSGRIEQVFQADGDTMKPPSPYTFHDLRFGNLRVR